MDTNLQDANSRVVLLLAEYEYEIKVMYDLEMLTENKRKMAVAIFSR